MNPAEVPKPAVWLGGAGALPFLAGAALAWLGEPATAAWADLAVRAYGACILSFMGGIHWGLAIAPADTDPSWARLGLSVVWALLGWLALLLPATPGLLLLAAAFAGLLAVDLGAVARRQAPAWYPKLRWPLTTVVVASLLVAALA